MDCVLRIPSVTGVDVEMKLAGPGGRSYAFIVDWHIRFLVSAAWFLLGTFAYTGTLRYLTPTEPGGMGYAYVVTLPSLGIYFLYHPVLEVLTRGRTPGKRIAGVRLVSLAGGGTPSVSALLVRNVFRLVDCLPGIYAVGLVATLLTRHAVRLGDIAAGTVLVYEHERDESLDESGAHTVGRLEVAQAQLVRDLLDRWQELGEQQRARLARELLGKLGSAAPVDDGMLRAALEDLLA